ncbi:MAG: MerR family transcriptional regulator [Candidatus Schekmanbacteria bacterium]|nr:MAG: MerR family transcriptional regulator [Candidatus Schekmanbacteria bacterium]
MKKDENGLYKIGEVAKKLGISTRTLRYYEELGLLNPPSKTNGKVRYYNKHTIFLVKAIRKLQSMGLTLDEIKEISFLFETDPTREKPKRKMLEKLSEQKAKALEKIKELNRFVSQIDDFMLKIEAITPRNGPPDGDILDLH